MKITAPDEFSEIMSRANVVGVKLASEVAPQIILQEEGLDPRSLNKIVIPDSVRGIEYDLVDEKCSNVFWVTHVTRGHFNKNFQKNVGELLFLKLHAPHARCGVVLGKIPQNYRPDYEIAYRLLWDAVYVVERVHGKWIYPARENFRPEDTAKQIAQEILLKQIERIKKINSNKIPQHLRFCSLPSFIGSSGFSLTQYVLEKVRDLRMGDLNLQLIEPIFNELIEKWVRAGVQQDELKTLDNGLTLELIFKSIKEYLEFLLEHYPHYKISRLFQARDWNGILNLFPPYKDSPKYWDYYNPTEFLVEGITRSVASSFPEKIERIQGCPVGFPLSTFFNDLGLNIRFKEDIGVVLRNGKMLVFQVKALSGARGASGPKQAGYEGHRMAGLSFATRWKYDKTSGEINEKPLEKIVVLDGYWKGPIKYPAKTFDYIYSFARARNIFLIDEVNQMIKCLSEFLESL